MHDVGLLPTQLTARQKELIQKLAEVPGIRLLTTVSRLLAKELSGTATDESSRRAVVKRLDELVAPPDIYLELQFYAAAGAVLLASLISAVIGTIVFVRQLLNWPA